MDKTELGVRVLHVLRPAEGGMLRHLANLFVCMDKNRYRLGFAGSEIGSESGRVSELLGNYAADVYDLKISASLLSISDAFAIFKLNRIVSAFKPDIIHVHGIKAALVTRLGRLCRLLGKKAAIFVTLHNIVDCGSLSPAKKRLFLFVERALLPHTDGIIAVSEAVAKSYISLIPEAESKIRVIYNGIEIGVDAGIDIDVGIDFGAGSEGHKPMAGTEQSGISFEPYNLRSKRSDIRSRFGVQDSTFCIGFLARLIPEKGIGDMLDAAKILKDKGLDFTVLIAGDGPSKEEFVEKASSSGLDGIVRFLGFRDDVEELLAAFDLIVLPSWNEGFPMTILEAMRAGCPVVAAKTGGIPEMIEDGVSGFLIPPRSPEKIAELLYILSGNREMLRKAAESARARVKNLFRREIMAKRTEDFYEDIIKRKNR